MTSPTSLRYELFDASAAVKLVLDEPGSKRVRADREGGIACITTPCLIEALSVLKRAWLRKALSDRDYHLQTYVFPRRFEHRLIDVSLEDPEVLFAISKLGEKHGLDFMDALQLHSLLRGRLSTFVGGSQSLLVTADRRLADAGRGEGLLVWDILASPCPP